MTTEANAPDSGSGNNHANTNAVIDEGMDLEAELQEEKREREQAESESAAVDYAAVVAELEAALAAEHARANDLIEKSQRMAAEFQNSRRRQERQLAEEIERASSHLVKRLLPIVDDFDLAFANVPADLNPEDAWIGGFRQIQKKLHALLQDEGVQAIPVNGEFDPALHEAVVSEASTAVPSGHITGVLRAGYTHKGRVLRPALVRVAT